MIEMPRRSVTRFFIPLIDVLLLLFCIFLLMPFVTDEALQEEARRKNPLAERVDLLENELRLRDEELARLEKVRISQAEMKKLEEEAARLRAELKKSIQARAYIQVVDIDPKNGRISWYDPRKPDAPVVRIDDAVAAARLIARHEKEGAGRELFYLFRLPHADTLYPTLDQWRDYRRWFAGVGHSLEAAP